MNIRHLEYFLTVAEMGSINKAAHALFISQPHLGNIIRDLEDEMGVMLFQRTRHGVILTPEGSELCSHAAKIIDEYREIQGLNRNAHHNDASLEVSMTKFSHIMESFIAVVLGHKEDPVFSHQLNEGSPEDVIEDVFTGMSRIGVLNFDTHRRDKLLSELAGKRLSYHYLAHVEPHILVSENHPLLKEGKPVNLETLAPYGFVRYMGSCEDFTYRIRSEYGEQNLNKSPRIVYTHGRSTLLHMIGNSDFYGIGIYDFRVQESAYKVRSLPIEGCDAALEFGYILPKDQPIAPITQEFIDNLKQRFLTVK